MKKLVIAALTVFLTLPIAGCSSSPDISDVDVSAGPAAEIDEPAWAQGKQTDGQLFQGLDLDGVGEADDEAYVSVCQYGDHNERITILRIHLGTGETIANIFPVYGRYSFLTGNLFSQDKEAIVLEISVPGSNYNAADLFVLDISPAGSDPIPTSTVRMDTVKGICLNAGAALPEGFDTSVTGSTRVVDVDGSPVQGLEIHAVGADKEDLSQTFYWVGGNTWADDGWALGEDAH